MTMEKFRCRLCGHGHYLEIRHHNGASGPGNRSFRLYYACRNCSSVFLEPECFSLPEDSRVNCDPNDL